MGRSPRQDANLKRGGVKGDARTAARARAAKQRHAEEDQALAGRARADPEAAVLDLHADLTVGVRRLMRSWLAKGGNPPKVLIEALREFRQASRDAIEYLTTRGADARDQAIFEELDGRVAAIMERVGPPQPPVEANDHSG